MRPVVWLAALLINACLAPRVTIAPVPADSSDTSAGDATDALSSDAETTASGADAPIVDATDSTDAAPDVPIPTELPDAADTADAMDTPDVPDVPDVPDAPDVFDIDADLPDTLADTATDVGPETSQDAADGTGTPPGMVAIPAGVFWMGCNASKDTDCDMASEAPQHKVTLSGFDIDLTETTVAQYKQCVNAGTCSPPIICNNTYANWGVAGKEQHPVNCVTWTQARQFCNWRGAGYDLPTEAQWEMAARGSCVLNGSSDSDPNCATAMRTFPWGQATASCDFAIMLGKSLPGCQNYSTWPVGSSPKGDSPYGVHDMAGNVWEWVRDGYWSYKATAVTDPVGATTAPLLSNRGGGFESKAIEMRSSGRSGNLATDALFDLGLRCVRTYP